MRDLLYIQQDIRKLENSVNSIIDSIRNINSDIDELRAVDDQDSDIDYLKIELFAKQFAFGEHPLDKLEDYKACKIYLEMLLNIVKLDFGEEISLHRLIFIQWIKEKSRIDCSLEDLIKDCYNINADSYHKIIDIIPKNYRECFIVDALIVANLDGLANTKTHEYIANLVAILGIDKKRLKTLSLVARAALCQNAGSMTWDEKYEFQNCAERYKHYIKADIPINAFGSNSLNEIEDDYEIEEEEDDDDDYDDYDFFEEEYERIPRQIVVAIIEDKESNFKWRFNQMKAVKKGDVIATFDEVIETDGRFSYEKKEVVSPSSGTLFQSTYKLPDMKIKIGVLSNWDDKLAEEGKLDANKLDDVFEAVVDIIKASKVFDSDKFNIATIKVDKSGIKINVEYYDRDVSIYKIKKEWEQTV